MAEQITVLTQLKQQYRMKQSALSNDIASMSVERAWETSKEAHEYLEVREHIARMERISITEIIAYIDEQIENLS